MSVPSTSTSSRAVESAPIVAAEVAAPVSWRELLAISALIVVADLTIFRGHGFGGYAAFLLAAPLLLTLAAPQPRIGWRWWLLCGMLILLTARILWCGAAGQVAVGLGLLVGVAMVLSGRPAHVLEGICFAAQAIPAGLLGMFCYARSLSMTARPLARFQGLALIFPLLALIVFSTLFILANPNLLSAFGEGFEQVLTVLRQHLLHWAPSPLEMFFWLVVLWLAAGLIRPMIRQPLLADPATAVSTTNQLERKATPSPQYRAYRNTLLAVIVLFAVYLVFEFKTLWFREFPPSFHYSGYAHEGAAWLTVALAVATLLLSLIFSGSILHDNRLPHLRRLAWIWSAENLLLAIAVYNRLHIYIGFNGLSPMRMVGIYGITAVVVGLLLVVYKITYTRSFLWLLHRQLAVFALIVYLFAVTPVDWLVSRYNVQRILSGDPAPSVQISVRPIDAEGSMPLLALLDSDDPIIREGVKAMLAQRQDELELQAQRKATLGWTATQFAERSLLERLHAAEANWSKYQDAERRKATLEEFHAYAYQWY